MSAGLLQRSHSMWLTDGALLLCRQGWRPRRSIWLCSWDAVSPCQRAVAWLGPLIPVLVRVRVRGSCPAQEEYALTGSVEFVEHYFKQLYQNAVAYLNVDVGVSGSPVLDLSGMPSFAPMVRVSLRSVFGCPADHCFLVGVA